VSYVLRIVTCNHESLLIYFLPRDALQCKAQSCYHLSSVRPSVTLVDHDHISWKSWKLTARTISPVPSLFVAERSSTYSQGNMEKFGGENVRSTPTSITPGWNESTESHVILGGGVALWLFFYFYRNIACTSLRSESFLVANEMVFKRVSLNPTPVQYSQIEQTLSYLISRIQIRTHVENGFRFSESVSGFG